MSLRLGQNSELVGRVSSCTGIPLVGLASVSSASTVMAERDALRKRERAAVLKRKFQKLDTEAVQAELEQLAKRHPALVPKVIEYYEHLVHKTGPPTDDGSEFVTPPCMKMKRSPSSTSVGSVVSTTSLSGSVVGGKECMGSEEGAVAETKVSMPAAVGNSGPALVGKKLSAHTADEMVAMLTFVEPGVFAKEVLKARLGSRRARYLAKEKLYPYFSFVFGMRAADVFPALATEQLHEALKRYSEVMDRPARDLPIPTEWSLSGVFRVHCVGKEIHLENSRIGETKVMTDKVLIDHWDGSELTIADNMCASSATVCCERVASVRIPCLKYFPEEAVRSFPNWWVNDKGSTSPRVQVKRSPGTMVKDKGSDCVPADGREALPVGVMTEDKLEPASP
eukprot:1587432-Amphidinium_carterae.1